MALLFCDGFDNYQATIEMWDFAGGNINNNLAFVRTGIQSLGITGAFGPVKLLTSHPVDALAATAYYCNLPGTCIAFGNEGINRAGSCVSLQVNLDGSLSVLRGRDSGSTNGPGVLGQTLPGVFVFNTFNLLALRCTIGVSAMVNVWVNGKLLISVTGVDTTNHLNPTNYFDSLALWGPGGLPNCFHDDVYILDCGSAPNNDYLGPLRLFALPPTANAGVTWIPNANTNWQQVDEVPPDGDTSFVSSGNVGDQDQYIYPGTGIPANAGIPFIQHELDMEVDSGSRSVGSVVNGSAVQNPIALSNGYHIFPTPYDRKPGGSIWTPADFPIQAGPRVTL